MKKKKKLMKFRKIKGRPIDMMHFNGDSNIIRTIKYMKEDLRAWTEQQLFLERVAERDLDTKVIPANKEHAKGLLEKIALKAGVPLVKLLQMAYELAIGMEKDPSYHKRYAPLFKKFIKQCSKFDSRIDYEDVYIIDNPDMMGKSPNAASLLDKWILINTSFCKLFGTKPSVWKFVLAHELCHNATRATSQMYGVGLMLMLLVTGTTIAIYKIYNKLQKGHPTGKKWDVFWIARELAVLVVQRLGPYLAITAFSRRHERKADLMAINLMVKAEGLRKTDLNGAFYFFDYVMDHKPKTNNILWRILGTHPHPAARVAYIYRYLMKIGYDTKRIKDYKSFPQKIRKSIESGKYLPK